MEARSTRGPYLEPEPVTWQPRVTWASGRLLAGAITFFFISFVFAYFYLRSLDLNHNWKIGHHVNPSIGLGIGITASLVVSAALMRIGARRPLQSAQLAVGTSLLGLLAVVLQVIEWTKLGFGPASGGYASVFTGWTVFYAVLALPCLYWIETQAASVWRRQREGEAWGQREGVPAGELELMGASFEACSFFWAYYVFIGVVTFVILYLL
jgi:heme/copper-type cytochrome/quinol oxidase subunit 3